MCPGSNSKEVHRHNDERHIVRTCGVSAGRRDEGNKRSALSTARLNTLRCVHRPPINVVVYYEPIRRSGLEEGFPLRCFQRLSRPDVATQQCSWRNNWHTSGQSTPVLSY